MWDKVNLVPQFSASSQGLKSVNNRNADFSLLVVIRAIQFLTAVINKTSQACPETRRRISQTCEVYANYLCRRFKLSVIPK